MKALLIIGLVLGTGMFLIIHGTIFKTRWGINLARRVRCPRCGAVHGQVRAPQSAREILWGGLTCDKCGLEVDKWNRPIDKVGTTGKG